MSRDLVKSKEWKDNVGGKIVGDDDVVVGSVVVDPRGVTSLVSIVCSDGAGSV